ncbi:MULTISPECIES: GntR family transcriptional regulator [unclassified Nocardioides]|uniref:GntR family transcriptional regulator n=1 Tax=unclassified Nocardioides TaxID=2615069 RepID=UPI0000574B38|nr:MULTISPECIES: GntR family transcriptional regulator [unclassified Nocardioides]ABL80688.1 transcriptional regulator, GntR family [Nocardioides sp. JS614]
MSSSDPLTRSVLADQVKEWLLEAILGGAYPPDSRIVETAVAKELGTSQAPVREALRGLEALGIVEIAPFRGARVRRLEAAELLEAYVVRCTIEVLGARLAMARLTDEDIAGLLEIGEQMQSAADASDGRALAVVDASLHGRIMELAGNRTLLRVWRSLEPISRTYITLAGPGSDPQWTAGLHTPILDAIRLRDTDGVVHAIESHFDEIRDWLADHLAEVVEQQAAGTSGRTDTMSAGRGHD